MKVDKKKILVLEAGGPCGISCIKLLRKNKIGKVIAADMDSYSPAFLLADSGYVVPASASPDFMVRLVEIVEKENIDIIMPTFEHGHEKMINTEGLPFVTDFPSAILCKDKLLFNQKCIEVGLPVPITNLMSQVLTTESPVYIKPRVGVGTRNNCVANMNEDYLRIRNYILDKKKLSCSTVVNRCALEC